MYHTCDTNLSGS